MDPLPAALRERLVALLGREEYDRILSARSRPSIRVNTLKSSRDEVARRLAALGMVVERPPFADEALWVTDPLERAIGATWEHQAGHFFGQDAASLLPIIALDPRPGERVLDLCAAPGGKTGHIAARMGNRGLVVANDSSPGRLNHLLSNLDRLGCLNVVSTASDGRHRRWPITFDRVLVDAPCSNLGTVHVSWKRGMQWNEGESVGLARTQRELLAAAVRSTREGGTIVYSTCTLDARENEELVSWALGELPVAMAPLRVPGAREGLTHVGDATLRDEVAGAVRVHPGDVGTEGFFVARLRKTGPTEAPSTQWRNTKFALAADDTIDGLVKQYQLDAPDLLSARAVASEAKLFATSVPDLEQALKLGPHRLGLALGKPEDLGTRLTFDAATMFGRGAGRTIELAPREARAWVAGNDLEVGRMAPLSIVACGDEPIGAARTYGTKLPCFVPSERRVAEDGVERWGVLAV